VSERRCAGLLQVGPGDWRLGGVVVTAGGDSDSARDRAESDDNRADRYESSSSRMDLLYLA
jgi:hypothetical protein